MEREMEEKIIESQKEKVLKHKQAMQEERLAKVHVHVHLYLLSVHVSVSCMYSGTTCLGHTEVRTPRCTGQFGLFRTPCLCTLQTGHLTSQDAFFCPKGVGLERFHCLSSYGILCTCLSSLGFAC